MVIQDLCQAERQAEGTLNRSSEKEARTGQQLVEKQSN